MSRPPPVSSVQKAQDSSWHSEDPFLTIEHTYLPTIHFQADHYLAGGLKNSAKLSRAPFAHARLGQKRQYDLCVLS